MAPTYSTVTCYKYFTLDRFHARASSIGIRGSTSKVAFKCMEAVSECETIFYSV